jgi:hypothetical protein
MRTSHRIAFPSSPSVSLRMWRVFFFFRVCIQLCSAHLALTRPAAHDCSTKNGARRTTPYSASGPASPRWSSDTSAPSKASVRRSRSPISLARRPPRPSSPHVRHPPPPGLPFFVLRRQTVFDRMFSLGVRGSGTDTAPLGARVAAVAGMASATLPRRHFLYCSLRPENPVPPRGQRHRRRETPS